MLNSLPKEREMEMKEKMDLSFSLNLLLVSFALSCSCRDFTDASVVPFDEQSSKEVKCVNTKFKV